MELVEITPRLHLIRYAFGQGNLWQDDGLTVVDAGVAGSASDTGAAIRAAGREPCDLWRVVPAHGAGGLTGPPSAVDRELADGDELAFGGGAQILAIPGHTDGSIAIHLPAHGILFTGDAVAQTDGKAIPGVFTTDRPLLLESFRLPAALDVEIACFGHTDPFTEDPGKKLRAAS
jgi:hypothetical protein